MRIDASAQIHTPTADCDCTGTALIVCVLSCVPLPILATQESILIFARVSVLLECSHAFVSIRTGDVTFRGEGDILQ